MISTVRFHDEIASLVFFHFIKNNSILNYSTNLRTPLKCMIKLNLIFQMSPSLPRLLLCASILVLLVNSDKSNYRMVQYHFFIIL